MVHEAHAHLGGEAVDGAEVPVDFVRALLITDVVLGHDARVERHRNCKRQHGLVSSFKAALLVVKIPVPLTKESFSVIKILQRPTTNPTKEYHIEQLLHLHHIIYYFQFTCFISMMMFGKLVNV